MFLRLPYFTEIPAVQEETPFGIPEITPNNLYDDEPISQRHVLKIDLLYGLKDEIGPDIIQYRDFLYEMISATNGIDKSREDVMKAYKIFRDFDTFVNKVAMYSEKSEHLCDLVLQVLLHSMYDYKEIISAKYDVTGVKYLMDTHCYLYYGFRTQDVEQDGAVWLC